MHDSILIAQKINSKNICYWVDGDKEFISLLTYTWFESKFEGSL